MRNKILLLFLLLPQLLLAETFNELLIKKDIIKAEDSANTLTRIYYREGVNFEFPEKFTLQISSMLQNRYTFTDYSDAPNKSSFSIDRARLILFGKDTRDNFSFRLQVDGVGRNSNGEKLADLRDAWIKSNFTSDLSLQLGQFKVPFSRQYITSTHKTQFADRSEASNFFFLQRQPGALSTYNFNKDGNVSLGIFNGESTNEGINRAAIDTKHTELASFRYNLIGNMDPFEESDYRCTDNPSLTFGSAFALSKYQLISDDYSKDGRKELFATDISFKYKRVSFFTEYYSSDYKIDGEDTGNARGYYIQGGYFITPKVEFALRHGQVNCSKSTVCKMHDEIDQSSASLNYYILNYQVRLQISYENIREKFDDTTSSRDTDKIIFQATTYL